MSVDDYDYINEDYISECCGQPILGEIIQGVGICSGCHEWAGVEKLGDTEE